MMHFRQRSLFSLFLILALSLALAACVRPVPGNEVPAPTVTAEEQPTNESDAGAPETPTAESPPDAYPYPGTEAEQSGDTLPLEEPETPDETAVDQPYPAPEETSTDEGEGAGEETAESPTDDQEPAPVEAPRVIEHVVEPTQTLYSIGLVYGYSWVILAEYNDIANPAALSPGQVIRIPSLAELEDYLAAKEAAALGGEAVPEPAAATEYVVQEGDNLYSIALKHGLNWVQIAEANGITDPTQIKVGQTLQIPAAP